MKIYKIIDKFKQKRTSPNNLYIVYLTVLLSCTFCGVAVEEFLNFFGVDTTQDLHEDDFWIAFTAVVSYFIIAYLVFYMISKVSINFVSKVILFLKSNKRKNNT